MNLIFIESKAPAFLPIKESFEAQGFEISIIGSPKAEDFNEEEYLQKLMQKVSELDPVFIFSLDFIPFISLACGAMNMPYVSWLYDPYNKDFLNQAIANPWNFVFSPDSYRVNQLKRNGVEKVFYLPLAPTHIEKEVIIPTEYKYDMAMWMDTLKCEKTPRNAFGTDAVLKDATVGYLDGLFDCVKQDFTHVEYAKMLPDYCINDIEKNIEYKGNKFDFYDSEYFYPFVTYLDSVFYFPNKKAFAGMHVNVNNIRLTENFSSTNSKINIFIHPRCMPSGISQYVWNILGENSFLICNLQKDMENCGLDILPTIKYSSDVYALFKKFKDSTELREESIRKIHDIIIEKHSYQSRVEEMLNMFD